MALIYEDSEWRLNRINCGPPYTVACIFGLYQVVDGRGTVAVSGPQGQVFCASLEHAKAVCAAANAADLPLA